MIRFSTLRKIALALPEVTEEPHFEKTSFRVKKKIFASYDKQHHRACIRLSETDQDIFSAYDKRVVFPVPNAWGKQGWTFIDMTLVPKELFVEAVKTAYCEIAPKKLSALIPKNT